MYLIIFESYFFTKGMPVVMDSLNLYTSKKIYITNDLYKYIKEVM